MWHAARAVDGRGPSTALVGAIPPVFGLSTIDDVIRALHFGDVPNGALSQICPALFACAEAGDEVACALVDRQSAEIVAFAVATLRRLDLLKASVPVVLGGGVVAAGNARLMDGIRDALASEAPRARIVHVEAAPVIGAALLALSGAGADADALARVRAELSGALADR